MCVGKHLKTGGTELEGDSFEFITVFDTLSSMGQDLKSFMSSQVLGNLLAPVVEENGGKNCLHQSTLVGMVRRRASNEGEGENHQVGLKKARKGSAGVNEGSAYFQPVACPGQQDLGV